MESFDLVNAIPKRTAIPQEGDYFVDGLLHCGKCRTPRQCIVLGVPRTCDCECRQREWEEEQERQRKSKKLMKAKELTDRLGIEFSQCRFDVADDNKYVRSAKSYCDNWEVVCRNGDGFLFCGPPGTGKTFTAGCIANELINTHCVPVIATSFPKILADMQGFGKERSEFLNSMRMYGLIIIDDLGVERDTPYANEIVYSVIDQRYSQGLPMIVTTNLTEDELKNASGIGLRRIYDRLTERCTVVNFKGPNKRKELGDRRRDRLRRLLFGER